MVCKNCGSQDTEYIGISDGHGDDGSMLCEDWICNACDTVFPGRCYSSHGVEQEIDWIDASEINGWQNG